MNVKMPPQSRRQFYLAVVLFNPETDAYSISLSEAIKARLESVVIDNSVGESALKNRRAIEKINTENKITYIASGANVGLAAAYNRAIEVVNAEQGAEGIVFLDQDSIISRESIELLVSAYWEATEGQLVGVVAGMPVREDGRPYRIYSRRGSTRVDTGFVKLEVAPSSFSLVSLAAISRVGNFYDDFFIDQIDRDFCYRCHRSGLQVLMEPKARFLHNIGEGAVMVKGHYIAPISSPFRHYYQVRNLLLSARRGGVPWAIALKQIFKRFVVIAVVGAVAGHCVARYTFAFRGLADGLRNHGGPLI